MADQNQTFKLNTSNYIGFEYKKYLNEMKALALTNPTEYARVRNETVTELTDQISKSWYEQVYNVLTDGSNEIKALNKKPSYPQQELAKIALSHTQTIVDMMDEIVELLLPEKYLATAMNQLEAKRGMSGIN